jgi:hypothetical protein
MHRLFQFQPSTLYTYPSLCPAIPISKPAPVSLTAACLRILLCPPTETQLLTSVGSVLPIKTETVPQLWPHRTQSNALRKQRCEVHVHSGAPLTLPVESDESVYGRFAREEPVPQTMLPGMCAKSRTSSQTENAWGREMMQSPLVISRSSEFPALKDLPGKVRR